MRYRNLGTTGLRVSEVGFGTWAIGGQTPGATSYGATDDATSLKALRTAVDVGINFFDTANIYGNGHSEELLGTAFAQMRHQVVIASKCGIQDMSGARDFSAQALRKSVEGSLRRLGTDFLDILQLHDPPEYLADSEESIAPVKSLLAEGKIRALGVSVKSPVQGLSFLAPPWQSIQCNFNMIDQRALDCGLIERAGNTGISIIARTPLAFGFLSGAYLDREPVFTSADHRSRWPREQIQVWAKAPSYFAEVNEGTDRTLTQLALQFCISPTAVAATIPGITTPDEAIQNASAGSLQPLSDDELSRIMQIAKEHTFFI
jgi:aryl-alcohol dehydrogenase-like predicted oxidoreductase